MSLFDLDLCFVVADNCALSSGLEGVGMMCSGRSYLHLVSLCLFSSVLEFLESLL
jgi:hypothetical protein